MPIRLWIAISDVICYLLHIEAEVGLRGRLLLLKHFADIAARLHGAGPILHRGQVTVIFWLALGGFFGRFQPQIDLIPIFIVIILVFNGTSALIMGHY